MKVNGSVFVDKEGIVFSKVDSNNALFAVRGFSDMLKEANKCKDKLYYVRSEEWDEFFLKSQDFSDKYWRGTGQIAGQLLFNYGNPVFHPYTVNTVMEFDRRNPPRVHGGFYYIGCPTTNYVYDKQSIDKWHNDWFFNNPDKIDWKEFKNPVWPRFDRTLAILAKEIKKKGLSVPTKKEEITNTFHEHVIGSLDERERISSAKRIGAIICEANYYHREEDLEKLEADHGNTHAERIYSIKIGNKYQFLSVDKQHGMFELCDDKGNHQMEIRFDGTKNKDGEVNHSLKCVEEWKRKFNK